MNNETNNGNVGVLYVVATPIGNLRDIGQRALETLSSVDLILAEDTRHAGILLSHYGISKPTRSFHEHNEQNQVNAVVGRIKRGENMALISDAGTPLISDPGYRLVTEAVSLGIQVCPIPGPCAITTALCASGLATDRFCFEGFLSAKPHGREQRLNELAKETRTMVFYESNHRILDCIDAMGACLGEDRKLSVGREISKRFETFYYGSPQSIGEQLREDPMNVKGEFVVVVSGATFGGDVDMENATVLLEQLIEYMPLKKASEIAANTYRCNRNQLYKLGLAMKE